MKKLRSAKAVALVVALGRSESPVVVHHYLLSLCDHRSPRTSPARRVAARRVHLAGHFAGATPHPRPGRTKLFHLRRAGPDCGSCERSRPVHSDAATEAGPGPGPRPGEALCGCHSGPGPREARPLAADRAASVNEATGCCGPPRRRVKSETGSGPARWEKARAAVTVSELSLVVPPAVPCGRRSLTPAFIRPSQAQFTHRDCGPGRS